MIRNVWSYEKCNEFDIDDLDYEIDDLACLKNFIGSPPPPYTKEDLIRSEQKKHHEEQAKRQQPQDRQLSYNDVGEDIYVTIHKRPNEEIGLTILNGDAFNPSWPVVLDIKRKLPADFASKKILIGDQIKELYGIPTETLTHTQVLALFSKATDQVVMTMRRGVQPMERSFHWYKHPFSTVSHSYDEIPVTDMKYKCCCNHNDSDEWANYESRVDVSFQSFKAEDVSDTSDTKPTSRPMVGKKHVRSLSASAVTTKRKFPTLPPRQRRRTIDHTSSRLDRFRQFGLSEDSSRNSSRKSSKGPKYIADEIEKLSLSENVYLQRYNSQNSLNSSFSESTISSFSSMSTAHDEQVNFFPKDESTESNLIEKTKDNNLRRLSSNSNIPEVKTPVNIIRNSFRRRKDKKDTPEERHTRYKLTDNTLILTVWIADRKRLGLKLNGGSVSPYGDSNIFVREVKKYGSAYQIFCEGDEILEIDGVSTNGMDVYQAKLIINKLEGNYVEFKVFRPSK